MSQNTQIALKSRLSLAEKIIEQSPMTLMRHGYDSKEFAMIVKEAILNNPDILKCSEQSLSRAFRKCARDGFVPDGDSGAIIAFKNEAVAMPMVTGIKRMAYEKLGAEIRSGVVYEGDDIEIVDGVGVQPKIVTRSNGADLFKSRNAKNVIGAWCWLKLPSEEMPRITLFSEDEIARAKLASRAQRGPWQSWPDRMAEKACVKSAIWSLRYLMGSKQHASDLFEVVNEDNEMDVNAIDVASVEVETDIPEEIELQGDQIPDPKGEEKTHVSTKPPVPVPVPPMVMPDTKPASGQAKQDEGMDTFLPSDSEDDPTEL